MAMKRCNNGHYYDPDKYSSCPSCGISDLNITDTIPFGRTPRPGDDGGLTGNTVDKSTDIPPTKRHGQQDKQGDSKPDPDATKRWVREKMGIDPVVGWLVCVSGKEKGRDYRIRSERNFIGRAPKMDICVGGDETISRENHAVISYNPKKKTFLIMPGDGRGIVYLNDDEVAVPSELKPYDIIEMGTSKFLFLPLCSEQFDWEQ